MNYEKLKEIRELDAHTIDGIVECAQSAFGSTMTRDEVIKHLAGDVVTVFDQQRRVLGFGVSTIQGGSPTDSLFLAGAAVRKDAQRQRVYREINKLRLIPLVTRRLPVLTTRTQNPKVEAGIASYLHELKASGAIADYALTRTKIPGVYGRMLTETRPEIRPGSPYAELCYEEGDAFLLTFSITYR